MAVTGMKLDIKNSKKAGIGASLLRTVFVVAGLAGMMMDSQADDFAGLVDPTQPVNIMATASGAANARPMGPVLQSTFISASQRRAVISGRTYAVGEKFGAHQHNTGLWIDNYLSPALGADNGHQRRGQVLPEIGLRLRLDLDTADPLR